MVEVARVTSFHLDPFRFGASEVNLASSSLEKLGHCQRGLAVANRVGCSLSAQPGYTDNSA